MVSSRWRHRFAVAALMIGLLLPSAAAGAREPWTPVRTSPERKVFKVLWDFISQVLPGGEAKNRGQMGCDGPHQGLMGCTLRPVNAEAVL